MDSDAYVLMESLLQRAPADTRSVLDVGSFDVNGTLKPLASQRGWTYVGIDVRPGPNVDVLASDPFHYQFGDNVFDVVMCSGMLHNVSRPWLLIPEMARVLRPGGLLAIVCPWSLGLSQYPRDYFRVMPDGMEELFSLAGCLRDCEIKIASGRDVTATAIKAAING
jgi:SAM-dependent methyltransferase